MNDFKLMSSPLFWAAAAVIVIIHILSAVFKAHSGGGSKAIAAISIILHLWLFFYMLYSRAQAQELLLALLISIASNLGAESITEYFEGRGGRKDGI